MTRLLVGVAALLSLSCDNGPLQPIVTVEKHDDVNNCFATCPGSLTPAGELGLTDRCSAPAQACGFVGGADRMRVIIDYGTVQIDQTTTVPLPTLTLLLDGNETMPPSQPSGNPAVGKRRFFAATFLAPEKPAAMFGVRAKGAEGFQTEVDGFQIVAPTLNIAVDGCTDINVCMRVADVGTAIFTIDAPAGFAETMASLSSQVNGTLLDAQQVTLHPKGTTLLEGRAALSVPSTDSAQSGAWDVFVTVGSVVQQVQILLTPPPVQVSIGGCAPGAASCPITVGSSTLVTVTVPHDIHEQQASITTDVDGLNPTTAQNQMWNLESTDTRSAVFTLTAPAQGTSWNIHADVGRFTGQASASLSVPSFTVSIAGCSGTGSCDMLSDVGSAVLTIDGPRNLPQTTAHVSSRLNGLPQAQMQAVTLAPTGPSDLVGMTTLKVPPPNASRTGNQDVWDIDVAIGTIVKTVEILLSNPTVTLAIPECEPDGGTLSSCSVKVGSTVQVLVEAPHDINEMQAGLSASVDGVPAASIAPQQWSAQSPITTVFAAFNVTAPAQGTRWTLTGFAGPFSSAPFTVTLTP